MPLVEGVGRAGGPQRRKASEQSPERDDVTAWTGASHQWLARRLRPQANPRAIMSTIGRPGYSADRPPPPTNNQTRAMPRKFLTSLLHCRSGWFA